MEHQSSKSELRKHYFLDRYVVIAPKRNMRPNELISRNISHTGETATSPAIENDPSIYEIKNSRGQWLVKVIDNKYPAFTLDNKKAYGKQEVVIETPEHNIEFSELSLTQIERVFTAYAHRLAHLRKIKDIRHVTVFKNDGPKSGASIAHAHSQIFALPIVPPHLAHEATALNSYTQEYGTCAYCDLIAWEQGQKERIIYDQPDVVAYAPYCSENPFEAWISPKRHSGTFAELTQDERYQFAVILQKITQFLDESKISFNFLLQDSLVGYDHHFVLKVEPRQTIGGGFELSTGIIINPIFPESAADWYRQSFK